MNINSVSNSDLSAKTSFKRKPNAKEMKVYTDSLSAGLKLLNKQIDVIIHSSAAPSMPKENTGIGSLFSRTVQQKLFPFLKDHCITGIQQEPNNLRKISDPSPYAPESSAKNIFMIPLEKLVSKEYGNLLSAKSFKNIISSVKSSDTVDYAFVTKQYDKALREAYENFKKGSFLKNEFEVYKTKNADIMERNALFNILSAHYNKHWEDWSGIDKRLYTPKNKTEKCKAELRIAELKNKYKDEIEFFTFKQFLIDVANEESNILTKKAGIRIIGDSPVASPSADEWIYQDLFLKGKALGCPPDFYSQDGQRWDFRYFNPRYIFNPNGTLGKAGKILKEKYDNFFASFPGGLRIDHFIGLVDPFIYSVKSDRMTHNNSGRIYSQANSIFRKKGKEFENIVRDIVLKSAEEHGMSKSDVICEDLGEVTPPTAEVMKSLDLSGLTVTQFDYRGAAAPEKNVIMIGSHDNKSFIEYTDDMFTNPEQKEHLLHKTELLAEDTAPNGSAKNEIEKYRNELRNDKKKFMEAGFAELFTSPAKRIQIFFADFWGIGKTYNSPGTKDGNWVLRIGSDFENNYYKAVSDGIAPNLPKAVLTALRHRGLDKNHPKLIQNLEKSAEILAE